MDIDDFYKIAMIILGLSNAFIAYRVFCMNKEKTATDHNVIMLKTVVLDYNIHYLYDSFGAIQNTLQRLKAQDCNKGEVEKLLQDEYAKLYSDFVSIFSCVDKSLYSSLKKSMDDCHDQLVANIGDSGVNLYAPHKYQELIDTPFTQMKKQMISYLFAY